jgi:hypothetical protein
MRRPLPLVDSTRLEFGFERTVCACEQCTNYCRHVPGYLVPSDLERLCDYCGCAGAFDSWANQHLLASPGALVMRKGAIGRIPTLVPARRDNAACIFLSADSSCSIHPIAPFGCAFFDSHQEDDAADRRSSRGLRAILEDWQSAGPYSALWLALHAAGRNAPTPETARAGLSELSKRR